MLKKIFKYKYLILFLILLIILIILYFLYAKDSNEGYQVLNIPTTTNNNHNNNINENYINKDNINHEIKNDNINFSRKVVNKKYTKSKTLILSNENYTNIRVELYYADWCPSCNRFKAVWNKLKSTNNYIIFRDIDCTNSKPSNKLIKYYPSIIINNGKEEYLYEGNIDYDSLNNYLKNIK